MKQISIEGPGQTVVDVRRSSQARRLTLRVSSIYGRVTLTVPKGVSDRDAKAFALTKSHWIQNAVGSVPETVQVRVGAKLPVEGKDRLVVAGQGKAARILPTSLAVPESRAGPAIVALLKLLARDRLEPCVREYSQRIGQPYRRLSLRDTRSRWGSCTEAGNLMFSWRLIMAPPEVLDYVAAHEVAHLGEMNHSAAFWKLVRELCPEFEIHRKWLKSEGAGLHRYRFETS